MDVISYLLGKNAGGSILPSIYQQIEYIETTGTQYIDTDKLSTPQTKIEFTYLSKKEIDESYQNLFGTQYDAAHRRTYALITSKNNLQVGFNVSENSSYFMTTTGSFATSSSDENLIVVESNTKNHYVYDVPNKSMSFNDYTCTTTDILDLQGSYKSLLIFQRNANSGIPTVNFAKGKLYDFKWYENDEIVMDLVPCIRKIDNKRGLYDIIGNRFYGNAGSGEFN